MTPKIVFISETPSLLPPVRSLIERAYMMSRPRDDWPIVWMPDMRCQGGELFVFHDCTKLPAKYRPGEPRPERPLPQRRILMRGQAFVMNARSPFAAQPVYYADCPGCRIHFLAAAYDPDDTLENYIAQLGGKDNR